MKKPSLVTGFLFCSCHGRGQKQCFTSPECWELVGTCPDLPRQLSAGSWRERERGEEEEWGSVCGSVAPWVPSRSGKFYCKEGISPRLGLRRQVKEHPQGFSHPLWGTRFNSCPQGQSLRHLMIFRTLSVSQEFLLYREHSTTFGSVSAYPWEDFKTWGISQRERKKLPPEPVCFFSLPHSPPPSLPLSPTPPPFLLPSLPSFFLSSQYWRLNLRCLLTS